MTSTIPLDRYCPACGAAHQSAEDERCFACGASLDHASASTVQHTGERLAPGDLLQGRYVIVNQVGTGGYGAVYRAKDMLFDGKAVAIKAINVRDLTPMEAIDATDTFNREISLLSDLSHPNLPRVYDHFTDAAHWFLVMEFIEGETLEEYVRHTARTGQLPLTEVLEIGFQLCTVLSYLHTCQPPIIFRDVKPANIMRTRRGHLYLIDFGIARRHKPGQLKDTIALGSPGYAAPEQYGRAQTDAQADIYSLGVTLHQLLTGHDPAETPFHLPPLDTLAPHLPSELVSLIERMLDLDASKRPESMVKVKETLRAIALEQVRGLAPIPSATDGKVYYVPPGSKTSQRSRLIAVVKPSLLGKMMQRTVIAMTVLTILGGSLFGLFSYIAAISHVQSFTGPSGGPMQALRMPIINSAGRISLDPALANDPQSESIVSLVFAGLTGQSGSSVTPLLASWEVSSDGLLWTFTLQPNLRFNDGTPITADDVVFSMDRALQPATHSPTALATLGMIKDADRLAHGQINTLINDSLLALNPTTLLIKLSHPAPYFLSALAAPVASVVEKTMLMNNGEHYFNNAFSGTSGPFAVEQEYPSQYIVLTANAHYPGVQPRVQTLTLILFHSTQDSYNAYLEANSHYEFNSVTQVDIAPVPPGNLLQAESGSLGELEIAPQPVLYYYGMNYLEKPFDNILIRQALELALDKNLIAQLVWQDTRSPTNSLLPEGVSGYTQNVTGPDGQTTFLGNFSEAQQLLRKGMAEEGWSIISQIPPITFTYAADSPQQTQEIEVAIELWQQTLGITVKAQPVASDAILAREISATVNNPRGLQLWAASWQGAFSDPQQWLSLPFGENSPFNAVNYGQNASGDASIQQLVQQNLTNADSIQSQMLPFADLPLDQTSRLHFYQNPEQLLINDVAWIPMFQGATPYLFHSYVQGFDPNSQQSLLTDLSSVNIM